MSLKKIVHAVRGEQKHGTKYIDFEARLEATSKLEQASALGYLRALVKAGPADEDLPRAEAISILALAQPEAAGEAGLNPVEVLLQVATALEVGDSERRAIALLEAGFSATSESPSVLRAIETLRLQQRRKQRQWSEMIGQAEAAVNQGDRSQARDLIESIRAVDPAHPAVAQLERRLDGQRKDLKKTVTQAALLLAGTAALSGVVWLGINYERSARKAYESLTVAPEQDLKANSERLAGLESLVKKFPVWTGSLNAIEERAELRVHVKSLEGQELERQKVQDADQVASQREAEFAWKNGKMHFERGELEEAIQEFQDALEQADEGWDKRDRIQRDIEAIRQIINTEESK